MDRTDDSSGWGLDLKFTCYTTGALLSGDGSKCRAARGLSETTAADSCKQVLELLPQAKSDAYWIKIPGANSARKMCAEPAPRLRARLVTRLSHATPRPPNQRLPCQRVCPPCLPRARQLRDALAPSE